MNFSFSSLSSFNLKNKLKSLDTSKSVHETDVLTNILKENMDIFSPFFLLNYINDIIDSSSFPNHLKLSNLTPVNTHTHTHIHIHTHTHTHTNPAQNGERNYRIIGVLSIYSKRLKIS